MTHLKIREIYEYLDGDLPADRRGAFEDHLRDCARCRQAVEERRMLSEAASGIPWFEAPADFSERVMSRIPGPKPGLSGWAIALAGGLSGLAGLLVYLLLSGRSLVASLSQVNNSLWKLAKNVAVFFGKSAAVLSQAGKLIRTFLQVSLKSLGILTNLVSQEAQAALLLFTLVLCLSLFLALRRKIMWGDKI